LLSRRATGDLKVPKTPRLAIPVETAAAVYFRDGWICALCHRPTVFHLAFKYAGQFVATRLPDVQLAYFHPNWRRDASPLLDELGACVDHVHAYARGGAHDPSNFATACGKCNTRKSAREKAEYLEANPPHRVRGKYGEPTRWDGLSSLFVVLARESRELLTVTEKRWLHTLEAHLSCAVPEPKA
jgi:5-methylcytosine-specific restriction endonuclease McrA